VAVPKDDPRKRFDLEVRKTGQLLLGEIAHLRLGEADVIEVALADARNGPLDVSRAETKVLGGPSIELRGKRPDGGISVGIDFA
jgi:hypothetical protein